MIDAASTWQEKKTRLRDETRRERRGDRLAVDERSSDHLRERGNAAGTYLCGTSARYPDTGRAQQAMDSNSLPRPRTNLEKIPKVRPRFSGRFNTTRRGKEEIPKFPANAIQDATIFLEEIV